MTGLVEHLLVERTPLELAKELAQQAKENAALRERVARQDVELFWLKVGVDTLGAVREAVQTYYDALSARQHGGAAQDRAFNAIEQALGMSWQAGVNNCAEQEQSAPAALRFFGTVADRPRTAEEAACWCQACRPVTLDDCRMVLCPTCGNKRCPRADDHRNVCSGSNEPGQVPVRETLP